MHALPSQPRSQSSREKAKGSSLAIRTLWAAILVMHLAAVPTVIGAVFFGQGDQQSIAAFTRLAGLLASAAFFVLKIIDLPCLRLKPGWRSTATALLIIGLLHLGVVERAIEGEVALSPHHLGVVLFAVAIGQARVTVPVTRWLRRFSAAPGLWRLRRHAPERLGHAWSQVWLALLSFFTPAVVGPRPPPTTC